MDNSLRVNKKVKVFDYFIISHFWCRNVLSAYLFYKKVSYIFNITFAKINIYTTNQYLKITLYYSTHSDYILI